MVEVSQDSNNTLTDETRAMSKCLETLTLEMGTRCELKSELNEWEFTQISFWLYDNVKFQQYLYMEYISQLIRYSRACGSYWGFSQMTTDMFHLSLALPDPFLIHDLSPAIRCWTCD